MANLERGRDARNSLKNRELGGLEVEKSKNLETLKMTKQSHYVIENKGK
jgi:hypothetical protein